MKALRQTPPFRDSRGVVIPNSVAEVGYHLLGGVKQWVLIRGRNAGNPPLILLHGGPGMSEVGFFRYYNSPLEASFTTVNWDQRGAGKSFDPSIPKSTMTVAQFIDDLDDLVDLVRDRLGQPKVAILGHSWGSLLGVLYAARFPEKVSAYVGTGQVADWPEGERLSYQWALAEAERKGWRRATNALRAIGPPPYSVAALWVQRNWLARLEGGMSPRALLRMLRMVLGVPESSPFEVRGIFRALRWSMEAMWPEVQWLNLFEAAPELKVSVFFLLGRKDHWAPPERAAAYFEALRAPSKRLLWFETSGHEPFADEAEKFNAAMMREVRPVVTRPAPEQMPSSSQGDPKIGNHLGQASERVTVRRARDLNIA